LVNNPFLPRLFFPRLVLLALVRLLLGLAVIAMLTFALSINEPWLGLG
jgi:hypothetical protein